MVIRQGEIYWIDMGEPIGSGPGYRRPHVVVQNNILNQSRLKTVVVCSMTSNLRLAEIPGNVLISAKEINLPRDSVVNVSQLMTVDKQELQDWVGSLSKHTLYRVLRGIYQTFEPNELIE
ncbi:MAG: type II toxin-antitoxin system PemK/MazF family toxin [Caldilineaceae bacterium]